MSQSVASSELTPGLPEFISIAEKLQEAAQALITFSQAPAVSNAEAVFGASSEKKPHELRTFQIPGFMVAKEREMLELLKAENWQHVLSKTYEQLYTMALLMQHFEADQEIDGFSVQLMGNTLMAPLDTLNRLCSLVADFQPVAAGEPEAG